MRCIVHIGTEKTGSTAIQEFLFSNRELLRKKKVHVCTSMGEGNNRALPAAFMAGEKNDDYVRSKNLLSGESRKEWKEKVLADFSQEVAKVGRRVNTFVLSSEHFQSRLTTAKEVAELHSFLAPLFSSVTIVCYLRRQDEMAMSRYSEALRAGFTPEHPLPMGVLKKIQRVPNYFNFESLMKRWAGSFGEEKIMPRVYSTSELVDGDVVRDFLHVIGVEGMSVERSRKHNLALSAEAQRALYDFNVQFRDVEWHQARKSRELLVSYLETHATGSSRMPSSSQARDFYAVFESSNRYVAEQWFGRSELFNTDFSAYPDQEHVVDMDEVVSLLTGFIRSTAPPRDE